MHVYGHLDETHDFGPCSACMGAYPGVGACLGHHGKQNTQYIALSLLLTLACTEHDM